jgi:hypothetical protein
MWLRAKSTIASAFSSLSSPTARQGLTPAAKQDSAFQRLPMPARLL